MKNRWSLKQMTVLVIICMLIPMTSCSDDDEDANPTPYIGTWWRMEDETPGEEEKHVIKIMASTWEMKMQMLVADNWVDHIVIKGTYSETNKILTLTITEIGILENPPVMDYYTPSSPEWELILDDIEMPQNAQVKYIISGNNITFIVDGDENGIFDLEEEGADFKKL